MEINGKTLGGQGGEGVLIEPITVAYDTDQKGNERLSLILRGTAYTVLKNNYSKDDGFDELPEPLPVSQSIPIQLDDAAGQSLKITYEQLNKAFDLHDDPLIEKEGEWERFLEPEEGAEGAERSVYHKIVGKPIYFRASLKKNKVEGDKKSASDFWFNLQALAKTMEAKASTVKDLIAKIKAKKAAQESQQTPF